MNTGLTSPENWTGKFGFPSVITVSTSNTSIDPPFHIIALEGNFGITVSQNLRARHERETFWRDSCAEEA
jgi:hypothetical protein